MKKIYNIRLEPITAVHIGTGVSFTPINYFLTENNEYVKFSWEKILNRIKKDSVKLQKFYTISEKNDMNLLKDFFYENVTKDDSDYYCQCTESFKDTFEINKGKDLLENASEILETCHVPNSYLPYIPGSSIKGSIRTAILNERIYDISDAENQEPYNNLYNSFFPNINEDDPDRKKKIKDRDSYRANIQKTLLDFNSPFDDPFRTIDVTDCLFQDKTKQIAGRLVNLCSVERSKIFDNSKIQIQAELIAGKMIQEENTATFNIRINENLQSFNTYNSRTHEMEKVIDYSIDINQIQKACNEFYGNLFLDEYDKYYKNEVDKISLIENLKKELEKIKRTDKSFILRVGRWSQKESITLVDPFVLENQNGNHSRTVLDYNGKYLPLGWCKCTFEEKQ